MMVIKASSLEAVNRSWTLVAALTLMQLTNVREATGDKNRQDIDFGSAVKGKPETNSTH